MTWPSPGVARPRARPRGRRRSSRASSSSALAQQVGEEVGAQLARQPEGLGVAGGGEPDGQLRLHRPRQDAHLDLLPVAARDARRASPRQSRRTVSMPLEHHVACASAKFSGARTKSFGVPAGGERDARPGRRERLSTTDHSSATRIGWCSGSTTLPARMPHALGDGGDRRAGHRRVGVEAAEGVEVALRRPDRREAVAVGEAARPPAAAGTGPRPALALVARRSRRG